MKAKPVPRRAKHSQEQIHRVVLQATIKLSQGSYVVQVKDVAKRLRKDPRTVSRHLDLLQAAGRGMFVDEDHEVFALTETVSALVDKAEEHDFLRAGYAAAHRIGWEPEDDDWDL